MTTTMVAAAKVQQQQQCWLIDRGKVVRRGKWKWSLSDFFAETDNDDDDDGDGGDGYFSFNSFNQKEIAVGIKHRSVDGREL